MKSGTAASIALAGIAALTFAAKNPSADASLPRDERTIKCSGIPDVREGTYYNLFHQFLKEKKLNSAIAFYEDAVRSDPESPYPHYWLGFVYDLKDDHEMAVKHWKKAIELNPCLAEAYVALASFYYGNGDCKNMEYWYGKLKDVNQKQYLYLEDIIKARSAECSERGKAD